MRRILVGLAVIGITVAAPCFALADDQQIAEQIAKQLRAEKEEGNLKDFGIDLQVDEGTVSLKGHVASSAQRDLALNVVRGVSGVERVVDELQVQGAEPAAVSIEGTEPPQVEADPTKPSAALSRSDDELARDIMSRLKAHKDQGRLKGFSLQVKPQEGQVWLIGRVASEEQRQLVLTTAAHVPGVRQVVNALRVESPESGDPQATAGAKAGDSGRSASKAASPASRDGLLSSLLGRTRTPAASAASPARRTPAPASKAAMKAARPTSASTPGKSSSTVTLKRPTSAESPVGTAVSAARSVMRAGGQEQPAKVKLVNAEQTSAPAAMSRAQAAAAPPASYRTARNVTPVPFARSQIGRTSASPVSTGAPAMPISSHAAGPHGGAAFGAPPVPMHHAGPSFAGGPAVRYDHPSLPGYAWPSYASYPNYAAVTYPQQYSPTAWPYIGPFYPYPQVPLGWRKVTLEWDDGWWMLDFKSK